MEQLTEFPILFARVAGDARGSIEQSQWLVSESLQSSVKNRTRRFFSSGGRNRRQHSLHPPTEGCQTQTDAQRPK